ALDDINQFEQTDERIALWCEQIMTEMAQLL
ncbi:flavodoxin FldB, partial [Erwinia amylovora]|nr:flavodoxin FldB [Erwinia amylovora]